MPTSYQLQQYLFIIINSHSPISFISVTTLLCLTGKHQKLSENI